MKHNTGNITKHYTGDYETLTLTSSNTTFMKHFFHTSKHFMNTTFTHPSTSSNAAFTQPYTYQALLSHTQSSTQNPQTLLSHIQTLPQTLIPHITSTQNIALANKTRFQHLQTEFKNLVGRVWVVEGGRGGKGRSTKAGSLDNLAIMMSTSG